MQSPAERRAEHEQFKKIDAAFRAGDLITLLLSFGADPNQRGVNDYTSLHMAVSERNLPAVGILLEAGANPRLRTRIDDKRLARWPSR